MIYDRFPPYNVSGSARPFRFAKHLPGFGYLPTIVSLTPEAASVDAEAVLNELDPRVEILRAEPLVRPTLTPLVQAFAERKLKRQLRKNPDAAATISVGAERVLHERPAPRWTTHVSGFVIWSLDWYIDWGLPALKLATKAARRAPIDLVWASAPHSKNAFAGYLVSKRLGVPLILDQRDPWTYGSNWRPRLPATGRVETWWADKIMRHAARVVFTSPLTEREMQSRFPQARMCTISNGFETGKVTPLRDCHPDKCLFRYVGVLNDRRVPDVLLQGLQLAARDSELRRDVRLEFVGGMAGHVHKIAQFGLERLVSYRGHVPKSLADQLIHGSDVNVLLQTITTGQDVIAGKIFDYLAAHKPILAIVSKSGGDAWLLEKTAAGTVVSFEDPAGVARAIRELWQAWRDPSSKPAKAPDLAQFTSSSLTRQLAEVFDDVLGVG
jgi:glycosyltransferase involved in cell wall biosynthesis